MGEAIVLAAEAGCDIAIAGGVARQVSTAEATHRFGFPISSSVQDVVACSDVFLDFSSPEALGSHLQNCLSGGVPYLSGVTGLESELRDRLREASAHIPVFYASNFSIGVAVVTELVRLAAGWMPEADVEIIDLHHRRKRDAPSGTAISLLEAIEAGRPAGEHKQVIARTGEGARLTGEIGVHSLRGGGNSGEHQVLFASEGEEVWIGHRALSRATFAESALHAARWLVDQPPGLYGMKDLFATSPRS